MLVQDLGTLNYRDAWAIQEKIHAEVLGGGEERLLLVEHPPVITFGRRAEIEGQKNLIASPDYLEQLGVEIVQSDRGGDITFHGPGQVVVYPIVRLNAHGLSVGGYARKLENTVIAAMNEIGVKAQRVDGCVGIWVEGKDEGGRMKDEESNSNSSFILHPSSFPLAKLCAIGVRIRRGVSLHGIALNVETDLRYFDLIVPCGLVGKPVTSLKKLLGDLCPPIETVKQLLSRHFVEAFTSATSTAPQ